MTTVMDAPFQGLGEHPALFRALVIDNNDPELLNRVKLQVAQVHGEQITNWARTILPFCDPPEIGSFVWASFEAGDRNYPCYFSNNLVVAEVGDVTYSTRTEKLGWLLLDGASFNSAEYPELFDYLGGTVLPDHRGRQPITAGAGPGLTDRPLGTTGGVEAVALTEAQLPIHDHPDSHTHTYSHLHGLNNHVHGMNAHTHALISHKHPGASHQHTANHTHNLQDHQHGAGAHTHPYSDNFTLPAHTHANSSSVNGGSVNIDHSHALPQHKHTMTHAHGAPNSGHFVIHEGNNNGGLALGSGGTDAFVTEKFTGDTQLNPTGTSITGNIPNAGVSGLSLSVAVGAVTGASTGSVSGSATAGSGTTASPTTFPATATGTINTSTDGSLSDTGVPNNVGTGNPPSTPDTEVSTTTNTATSAPTSTDGPSTPNTGPRGGGLTHDNMAPYVAVNAFMYPGRRVPV